MAVFRPIPVTLPAHGVAFAESVHAPGFLMAERADAFHKIIYVLHGRVDYAESGGKSVPAPAGSVLCVQEGIRHRIADAEPPTLLLLCFSRPFLTRDPELGKLWNALAGGRSACLRPGRPWGQRFESLWRAAIVEQSGALPGRAVAVRAVAENILVSLARLPVAPAANQARLRVEAVARQMAETFYEAWNLEDACARAGMSRRHFSNLFRASTGRTFLEELTELRLGHAAKLLGEGRHSVIGAAFSSGYGDLSHFYRLFRQRHGHPPKAWAERARTKFAQPPS
jgi:AraC-like DNA-binding protein/quercetin dioxygenase-like cupin family protein